MLKCKTRPGYTPAGKQNVMICTVPNDDVNYVENIAYELLREYNCAVWYETDAYDASDEDVSTPEDFSLFVVPVLRKNINMDELMKYNSELLDKRGLPIVFIDKGGEYNVSGEICKYIPPVILNDDLQMMMKAAYDVYVYMMCTESERAYAKQIAPLKDSSVFMNLSRKLVRFIYEDKNKYDILYRYLYSSGFEMVNRDINLENLLPDNGACKEDIQKIIMSVSEDGDVHNLFVGYAYYKGIGVKKDIDKAIQFLTKASDDGYTEAMDILIRIYSRAESKLKYGEAQKKLQELEKTQLDLYKSRYEHDRNCVNAELYADALYDHCLELMQEYEDIDDDIIYYSRHDEFDKSIAELKSKADSLYRNVCSAIHELESMYASSREDDMDDVESIEKVNNDIEMHTFIENEHRALIDIDFTNRMHLFNEELNTADKFYIMAQKLWGIWESTLNSGRHAQYFENALNHSLFCAYVEDTIETKKILANSYHLMCNSVDSESFDELYHYWVPKAVELKKRIFEETRDVKDCHELLIECHSLYERSRFLDEQRHWANEVLEYYTILREHLPDDSERLHDAWIKLEDVGF